MVTEERGGWEFNGSGGRGKGKRASERAGRRDHGGEKRKGRPRASRLARLKTTFYHEVLALDHPYVGDVLLVI